MRKRIEYSLNREQMIVLLKEVHNAGINNEYWHWFKDRIENYIKRFEKKT